jgi:ATPase subunit of ABC transporter with duplicated ATPase domains
MSAQRSKNGLIVNVGYTKDEVRKPIMSQVIVEKIENLPGSTAGAGSGDFHQYRNLKRREEARLELMEIDYRERKIKEEFEQLKEAHKQQNLAATLKKASKRNKKKEKKKILKTLKEEAEKINKYPNDGSFIELIKKPKLDPE